MQPQGLLSCCHFIHCSCGGGGWGLQAPVPAPGRDQAGLAVHMAGLAAGLCTGKKEGARLPMLVVCPGDVHGQEQDWGGDASRMAGGIMCVAGRGSRAVHGKRRGTGSAPSVGDLQVCTPVLCAASSCPEIGQLCTRA